MVTISTEDPLAVATVAAIAAGDLETLRRLLAANPSLVTARLGDDDPDGMSRSLLHVATDWPGHFPEVAASIAVLVAAGADVNARFRGPHAETPLHWAASSDDVAALDALLDAGADIGAPPAPFWAVARRLRTPAGSNSGRLPFGWWTAAPALPSPTPRRSACLTASTPSWPPPPRLRMRSRAPSGVPATAADRTVRNTYLSKAQI